jgi:hypothetical protein
MHQLATTIQGHCTTGHMAAVYEQGQYLLGMAIQGHAYMLTTVLLHTAHLQACV